MGMVHSIMPNTATASAGIATTNISAARASTTNAIIMPPMTTNGLRMNRRRNRFSPLCTWLMSLVMRVMSVLPPSASSSAKPRLCMCSSSAWRSRPAYPTAAREAKNCAVRLHARPISPSPTSSAQRHSM